MQGFWPGWTFDEGHLESMRAGGRSLPPAVFDGAGSGSAGPVSEAPLSRGRLPVRVRGGVLRILDLR